MLFLAIVWMLYLLDRSLASEEGFEAVLRYAGLLPVKLSLLVLIWAFCHHFFAGIRTLFLDLDKGVDLPAARLTSWAVLAASLALTAWLGAKLW
jgi:succinate dehydrogenase / fumarate reductase cytochrome b subunit